MALASGDTYHFLYNELVLVFKVFFAFLMENQGFVCFVLFFFSLKKKKGIWSTFSVCPPTSSSYPPV